MTNLNINSNYNERNKEGGNNINSRQSHSLQDQNVRSTVLHNFKDSVNQINYIFSDMHNMVERNQVQFDDIEEVHLNTRDRNQQGNKLLYKKLKKTNTNQDFYKKVIGILGIILI